MLPVVRPSPGSRPRSAIPSKNSDVGLDIVTPVPSSNDRPGWPARSPVAVVYPPSRFGGAKNTRNSTTKLTISETPNAIIAR